MPPVLQVWSGPRCQAGAEALEPLPATTSAQIVETITGTDDGATLTLPSSIARACGVAEGRVLRAVLPLRGVVEWVLVRVQDSDPGDVTQVTLGPLRQLLALRPIVRVLTDVSTSTTLPAFNGTIAELLARRVLVSLAEDQLTWLSLGTIDSSAPFDWPEQTAVRRGEVLTLIEQVTGLEVALRRLANDAGYAIDVLTSRNGALDPVLFERGATAQAIARVGDLLQTATAVRPFGDDGLTLGEVDWLGGAATGSGPFWIPLSDPTGGPAPIQEDGQFVGAFLGLPGGSALPIIGSRVSDSAVQVASLGAYATGARVALWETAQGRPVSVVRSPSAMASSRGLVEAKATVKGTRQERTLNRNGDFLSDGLYWTHGAQGGPIRRTDLGKTLAFQVNGARSAGTGTGTPLAVDGLPANERVYEGDQMIIAGQVHTISVDGVPNSSGGITASITPNLAATYPDDTVVTIVRRERRTWLKNGTLSYSAWLANGGLLAMKNSQSDGLLYRPMTGLQLIHDASGMDFTGNVEGLAYDAGFAGAFTVNTSGAIGTPPAQFADNDTFTATFVRETRAFRFSGTQSSGASSVTFKNISALARRDWVNTDTLFARRDLTATARITAFTDNADNTYTATIDTSLSTLDEVASADRDGKALIGIPGNWTVYYEGGGSFSTVVLGLTVISLSGSTLQMAIPASAGIDYVTGSATGTPFIANAVWTVVDSYPVTAGAAWGSNGRATLTVSIPAGRTIARGTPLYANWIGGGASGAELAAATTLFAHATVTGSASSLEVAGWDDYRSDWDGSTPLATAVYRLFGGTGGSRWDFPGEVMVAAASTQANGSGQANVTLKAANVVALADNASISITRPDLMPDGASTAGSVMRLMYASGSLLPAASTPSVQSETAWISVPSGLTRKLIAVLRAVVSPGTYGTGGSAPQVALVNTSTNQTVAAGSIAEGAVSVDVTVPTEYLVTCTAELTTSGLYQLRLYGGSNASFNVWVIALDASFYLGEAILPFAPGARSRTAFHRAQAILRQRRSASRYRVSGIDQAMLAKTGTPLRPGQPARLRSTALGLDTTQRIVRLQWQFPEGALVEVECEAIAPRFTDVTVSL